MSSQLLDLWHRRDTFDDFFDLDGANAPYVGAYEDIPEDFTPIVINRCYGGARLSQEALLKLGTTHLIRRSDPGTVGYILTHGSAASSAECSSLQVYLIPTELRPYVRIDEYDGLEDLHLDLSHMSNEVLLAFLRESAPTIPEIATFLAKYERDFSTLATVET